MRIAFTGYRHTVPLLAAMLLAFLIPAPYRFGSFGVVVVTVAALAFRGGVILRNLRERKMLWAPVALYLWTLASWLWSADDAEASAILSTKLPILLLPVFIGCSGVFGLKEIRKVLFAFALGVVALALYCMANAWRRYQADHDWGHFFYHQLTEGSDANAVYVAWYVLAALLILLLLPIAKPASGGRSAWLRGALLAVLLPFFLLLSARTLLVIFLVIALPTALLLSFRGKMLLPQNVLVWGFGLALVVTGIFASQQPAIQLRFRELGRSKPELSFLKHYQGEERQFSNMNIRLFLWRVGLKSMVDSPKRLLLGAGVGDAHEAVHEQIRALGIPNVEKDSPDRSVYYNINLHNTYLHIAVGAGIPGLLLVVFLVGSLIAVGWQQFFDAPYIVLFALISAVFMMQEGVFETQAGTVFYMFFFSLFMDGFYNNRKAL